MKVSRDFNVKSSDVFEDALVSKQFLFNFVNSYAILFYIGLFKNYVSKHGIMGNPDWKDECYQSCMGDLMIQLVIILTGKQVIGQMQEIILPYVFNNLKLICKKHFQHKNNAI
jgi:threonine/homoserine/homoserine lactone efflux protein